MYIKSWIMLASSWMTVFTKLETFWEHLFPKAVNLSSTVPLSLSLSFSIGIIGEEDKLDFRSSHQLLALDYNDQFFQNLSFSQEIFREHLFSNEVNLSLTVPLSLSLSFSIGIIGEEDKLDFRSHQILALDYNDLGLCF